MSCCFQKKAAAGALLLLSLVTLNVLLERPSLLSFAVESDKTRATRASLGCAWKNIFSSMDFQKADTFSCSDVNKIFYRSINASLSIYLCLLARKDAEDVIGVFR